MTSFNSSKKHKAASLVKSTHALLVTVPMLFSGCGYTGDFLKSGGALSAQGAVAFDSKMQHEAILDLNDRQLLDNLYRAYNGLPILISDYSNIHQQMVTRITPSFSIGQTTTHNSFEPNSVATTVAPQSSSIPTTIVTTAGSAAAQLSQIARPINGSIGAERDHTIDLQQDPVYTQKAPYYAIIRFLALKKAGDYLKTRDNKDMPALPKKCDILSFRFSKERPPGKDILFPYGEAARMPDGKYYWVPEEYRADFFAMSTDVVARDAAKDSSDKATKDLNATVRRSTTQ